MTKKFFYLLSILFSISICFFCRTTYAASECNFSVRALIPDNQVDKNQTYFDLKLKPNEKQTIQLTIDNSEKEDIIVNVALNTASTGRNGLIVYNQQDVRDESLRIPITDVAKVINPNIPISANGSAKVNIEIQMPSQSFNGLILGGLVTTAKKAPSNQPNDTSLNNEYAYVIGLKITENDTKVLPDFDFVSVTPGLVNYRNAVTIQLRNKVPLILKEMKLNAKIYKKNSSNLLHELNLDNAEMAPNSTGDFVVDWESTVIDPGNYRLKLTILYQGKEWTWDEDFTISQNEADEANNNSVDLPSRPVLLYIIITIMALLIITLVFIIFRKKTKKG